MSRYLVRRIEESPSITLYTGSELIDLQGDAQLEQVRGETTGPVTCRHGTSGTCS